MNIRLLLSKLFAYLVLLVIATSLFLAFVTVPFHGPDNENQRDNIDIKKADYPTEFDFSLGSVEIANENGVKNPEKLMDKHISLTTQADSGYINYTYNSDPYVIHWSEQDVIVEEPDEESFITGEEAIQTKSGENKSSTATKIQDRYSGLYVLDYTVGGYINIENSMVETIESYNYTAVEAWESEEGQYIRYQADEESIKSEFVVMDSGVIKSFRHEGDTQFDYEIRLRDSAPPFFKPPWVVEP